MQGKPLQLAHDCLFQYINNYYKAGKFALVKHLWLAKIYKNTKDFLFKCFIIIIYMVACKSSLPKSNDYSVHGSSLCVSVSIQLLCYITRQTFNLLTQSTVMAMNTPTPLELHTQLRIYIIVHYKSLIQFSLSGQTNGQIQTAFHLYIYYR